MNQSDARWVKTLTVMLMTICAGASGQRAPARSDQVWQAPAGALPGAPGARKSPLEPHHRYTLPELIDLAEQRNPDTRVVWQQAKVRAAELGIARSDLLPTLVATATAATTRTGVLFNSAFVRQTEGLFEPVLRVSYTIFDQGRGDRIASARDQLLAANFAFNTVHLNILFETSRRYYRLLNAAGQRDAAELNLKNAVTVQRAVDARLANGLATLPDALEARAAAAQADFELQAAIGQVEIARGDLLTTLTASPTEPLEVQPLTELTVPDHLDDGAEAAIERGLEQRPELAERVAQKRAAAEAVRQARSAYVPTLQFQGDGGQVRAFGQQDLLPSTYAGPLETWDTSLSLRWTLFDGGRREAELARAHAEEHRAEAEIDQLRDEVEEQIWAAYVEVQTAFRQRTAAANLLVAARSSYEASLKSYDYGLRSTVDVVSAQRTLAQAISQDVAAQAGVLTQLATFAYRTGDLNRVAPPKGTP